MVRPKDKDTFSSVTASYEQWRDRRIQVVAEDVALKHKRFAESPFVMLRGTYYRFFEQFERLLPEVARAPSVVAVGDLHIENFGTWRDRAGRLTWGVNDLDEVDLLPYSIDLVRLAASALLALEAGHLTLDPDDVCQTIHAGWRARVAERRPCPFVLGERHAHLYRLASEAIVDPIRFEKGILALPPFERALPKPAARMLAQVTPPGDFRPQLRRRVAGVGSLGSRRIVAFGDLDGGMIVREAKQVPGPASMWAQPKRIQVSGLPASVDAARGAAADPWRRQSRKWVLRSLAPDATRLELAGLRRRHDAQSLLHSMGAEAANIHLVSAPGAAAAKAVRRDDEGRGADWLRPAAEVMAASVKADYQDWCN
jgi:Uncharacterized protein conserved in bacteria (DUF2252)